MIVFSVYVAPVILVDGVDGLRVVRPQCVLQAVEPGQNQVLLFGNGATGVVSVAKMGD